MANRWAVASGDWSNTATWNGGTLPTSADDIFANNFTVNVNQNIDVISLRNTATADVRSGTTYASGLYTGTLAVPLPSQVLAGIPTDATTGTLLMTPQQFWDYLISSGFAVGSIGERLQSASTVATTGTQIASYNI